MPASDGNPDPRPRGPHGGLDHLGHARADRVKARLAEPEPERGPAQPLQVPAQRERHAAGDLDRLEHAVAHGQAMIENRHPRVMLVTEYTVHPYLHENAP